MQSWVILSFLVAGYSVLVYALVFPSLLQQSYMYLLLINKNSKTMHCVW